MEGELGEREWEERRNVGPGRLSWGRIKGEKEKRYHNRWSHYRFEEKTGSREISRDQKG